jgi:hypothetical protein
MKPNQKPLSQSTNLKPNWIWKNRRFLLVLLVIFVLADIIVASRIPNFQERVEWRLSLLQYDLRSRLFPQSPDMPTLSPVEATRVESSRTAIVACSGDACASTTPTPTPALTQAISTPNCPQAGCATDSPTPTSTPLPLKVTLVFHQFEFQGYNNCGPANLSMMLRYWGWQGDQYVVADYTKPNKKDKNVMPYEMEDFVTEKTSFGVMVRSGGTMEDVRRLVAAGFPLVIEKSVVLAENNLGWMGHSLFITGYDDGKQEVTGQDSYVGADQTFSYKYIMSSWRPFNFHYIIAYPKDKEAEVRALLGPNADPDDNLTFSTEQALQETQTLADPKDLAFAWYNLGTNYVDQRRYVDAANAYDMARSLSIPWRIIWYETGPYKAYYWSQRYQEVIELATATLDRETELEESWYWRGMARSALGNRSGAISDWQMAVAKHPGFAPALIALKNAGADS